MNPQLFPCFLFLNRQAGLCDVFRLAEHPVQPFFVDDVIFVTDSILDVEPIFKLLRLHHIDV